MLSSLSDPPLPLSSFLPPFPHPLSFTSLLLVFHLSVFSSAEEKSGDDKDKKEKKEGEKDKTEEEKKYTMGQQQAVAVLGIALIAMGEDIGSEMAFRYGLRTVMS